MTQVCELQSAPTVPWSQDYPEAVVTLAVRRRGDEARLLLGLIELIPRGVVPPSRALRRSRSLPSGVSCLLERVIVACDVALRLRALLADGGVADVRGVLGDVSTSIETITLGRMHEEPPWPQVAFQPRELPLSAGWHGQSRVHHLLPVAAPSELDPVERARALTWLSECFFFEAQEYPELVGSVLVIAPNPRYAALEVRRVVHATPGAAESLALYFAARGGDDLRGLSVRVRSERGSGVIVSRPIEVEVA